jgi:pimeloyl-ACP methyl ester carboxylesterase
MDFDPEPVFAQVSCPVLLFYGTTDEWMPIDDSITAWRRATAGTAAGPTVHLLAGSGHSPTLDDGEDEASINPDYTATMLAWLDARLPPRR